MNTDTYQALIDWLSGRHYQLSRENSHLILRRHGQQLAVITPPDRYQIENIEMNFNEWVGFNKCIRNIRHYIQAQK